MDKKTFRLVVLPILGFAIGAVIGGVIVKSVFYSFFFGFQVGGIWLLYQWRWVNGKSVGMIRGDDVGPSPEDEFEDAMRKIKEKGGLSNNPDDKPAD